MVTGDASGGGVATITYTASTATCGLATTTHSVTVIPVLSPGTISGPTNVCVGNSIILTSSGATGGSWTSGTPSVATVDASGNVTGRSGGTVNITYTVSNSCGTFFSTYSVTVTPIPTAGAISGTSPICVGSTVIFTATSTGGTTSWTTINSSVASAVSSTGAITGVSADTTTVIFTVTNACGTASTHYLVTVNPLPFTGTISGSSSLCVGDTTTLTETATGGTWSSTTTGVATINSTTGKVTARGPGTTTINYTVSNSCGILSATMVLTVNALPDAGTVSGPSSLCEASSATFVSTGSTSGAWSSSAPGTAAVVSSTGVVTGGATAGTATISYIVTTATCGADTAVRSITINPLPHAGTITGTTTVCEHSTTTLTDTAGGGTGTWSTSNASIASVNATGVVTGVLAGTAIIKYKVTNLCGSDSALTTVTVTATPSAGTVTVPDSVCVGATMTVTSSGTSGGRWSTAAVTGVATIDSVTGVVTGVGGGTITITYTVRSATCGTYFSVGTVNVKPLPNPGVVSGPDHVCAGSFITMTDAFASGGGGAWTISPTSVASISTSGVVNGVSTLTTTGTAIVSYSVSNTCGTRTDTMMITVYPLPRGGSITGSRSVCVGATVTLTNPTATSGGIWYTDSTNAVVDITTGDVIGVSAGTFIVTYSVTSPYCGTASDTFSMTVNPLADPGVLSGITSLCAGDTATIHSTVSGGTWSISTTPLYASITSSGRVTGINAGTATVTYTVSSALCGPTYTTIPVTINALPNPGVITGSSDVCVTATTASLTTTGTTGGSWTSSGTNASVDATGAVTGINAGLEIITYTVTTPTCGTASDTFLVTVNPLPNAGVISIATGSTPFCEGTTISMSASVTGGTWSTSAATIASVYPSGVVYGSGGGSATISYTVSTPTCGSATATYPVSVNPLPIVGPIGGATSVCFGDSVYVTNTTAGGIWASSDPTYATIDSATGLVHAIRTGTVTLSYTVSNACGDRIVTRSFTVNPLPNAGTISGFSALCVGASTTLTTTGMGGGTWSTTSTHATVTASGGVVNGVSAGAALISYTVTTATCGSDVATRLVNIIDIPSADTIFGPSRVCQAASITLTDRTSGGNWTSSNPSIANVNTLGQVFGYTTGTVTITYMVMNVCGSDTAYHRVTVDPLPYAGTITGTSSLCLGTPVRLTVSAFGGVWSSTTPSVASVNGSGLVYGLAPGNDTVYYAVTNTCGTATAIKVVTVNPIPNAGTIAGPANICQGDTVLYMNTATTGYWTSSNAAIVAIYPTGRAVALAPGSVYIKYTVTNYCGTDIDSVLVTVHPYGKCFPDAVPEVVTSAADVTIFPNPATSILHIKADADIRVAVISPDGKMVLEQRSKDVDVSNLANGLYMIMIYDEKDNLLKAERFIKAD
ncbi:MAG: T9SS C-terminal target domain-containing protein [Chitinophagia bacterium]|nr:T9SS C-terminal target domain-containing protein [Chitinophagia bacterium]